MKRQHRCCPRHALPPGARPPARAGGDGAAAILQVLEETQWVVAGPTARPCAGHDALHLQRRIQQLGLARRRT